MKHRSFKVLRSGASDSLIRIYLLDGRERYPPSSTGPHGLLSYLRLDDSRVADRSESGVPSMDRLGQSHLPRLMGNYLFKTYDVHMRY